MNKLILTASPSITKKEIEYVTDAITNGHGEHWGDYIKRFEQLFAEYIGVKHAMTTSSCTGALHLALVALGIKEGDEVIVPDTSWIATASAVRYVGATPVFADVLLDSWCISVDSIEKKITAKTKAIIPVHLYGQVCDMSDIMELADRLHIKVLEDAAPALGAVYNNQKIGSFGHMAAFSFQGAKMLSTGEGGMLVTNDDNLYARVRHFAEHGRASNGFEISDIGFKYKMSNLQAAWGCAQLERIQELIQKKRLINSWYVSQLGKVGGIRLNKQPWSEYFKEEDKTYNEHPVFWMSSIVLDKDFGVTRDKLMSHLKKRGVDTRPFFPQISSFRMFTRQNNPVAKHIGENGINLPSFHDITQEEVTYICDNIRDILWV